MKKANGEEGMPGEIYNKNVAKTLYKDKKLEQKRNSDKSFIAPPQSQQIQYRTDKVLQRIREIFRPTLEAIQYQETISEIHERVYQRVLRPVNRYNKCILRVFDQQDYWKCDKEYLQEMENDVIEWAKETAKEY